MEADDELNTIYCRVLYSPRVNRFLVNDNIAEKLTDKAIERIRGYGINCVKSPPPQYGGGFDSLIMLLKELWELKAYLGIVVLIVRTLARAVKYFFEAGVSRDAPRLTISLDIRKLTPYRDNDWHAPVGDKLMDLKYLVDDISTHLHSLYPVYTFDQHLSLAIAPRSFRVRVQIDADKVSGVNNGRILRHLKRQIIRDKLEFSFSFAKFGLIAQTVVPIEHNGSGWSFWYWRHRTYYTWFSTRLITQFPGEDPGFVERLRIKLAIRTRVKNLVGSFKSRN